MSIECSECEADARGGHLPSCSRYREPKRAQEHAYKPEWGDGSPCMECMGLPGDHEVEMHVYHDSPPPGKTRLADSPVPYTRDWVMRLPLREQGTLMAAIRGCDTVVDTFVPRSAFVGDGAQGFVRVRHPTKLIIAALRYTVGVPHDPREVDTDGAFMASELPDVDLWPVKCLDDLPLHFVVHLMHAIEVIAYRLPDKRAVQWLRLYERICEHLHVITETRGQMFERLSEDRIAKGTVKVRDDRRANLAGRTPEYP